MSEADLPRRGRDAWRKLIEVFARAAARGFLEQRELGRVPSARKIRRAPAADLMTNRLETK